MKRSYLFLSLLLSAIITSCLYAGNNASGELMQKKLPLEYFDGIHVKMGVQLFINQGESYDAVIEAEDEIIDKVVIKNKNGELDIYIENPPGFNIFDWKSYKYPVKVYLTCRDIKELKASSGAKAESQGLLTAGQIDIEAFSGAQIKLSLNASAVEAEASSGAQIKLDGQGDGIEADASSGAQIDAYGFVASNGSGEASSGAQVRLFVNGKAKGSASSGGNVTVKGDVVLTSVDSSSGGVVRTE